MPPPDPKPTKLATIECLICSAWTEVYRQYGVTETIIAWNARDNELCQNQPLRRCAQALAEIRRRFPDEQI